MGIVETHSSERLSALDAGDRPLEEIIRLLPVEQRILLRSLQTQDEAYAADVGETFLRLQHLREESLKEAQANVSTDNSAAVFGIVQELIGERGVRQVCQRARIEPHDQDRVRHGNSRIGLAPFNRIMWQAWATLGRPDALHLFGAHMKSRRWGPVHELIAAYQLIQSIADMYTAAQHAVKLFNHTKEFRNVSVTPVSAMINSTIFPWIPPMDDYLSRYFVHTIMADIPYAAWEPYLQQVVGVSFETILEQWRNEHSYRPTAAEPDHANPHEVTGATFTEGIWWWWLERHGELQRQYQLPIQMRALIVERALQFPLVDTIEFHQRLADRIGWHFPIRNVYEDRGVVVANIDGDPYPIARRVHLEERGGRLLAGTEAKHEHPDSVLEITQTIPWSISREMDCNIFVCEQGQLWGAPTTQWEISWTNPPPESLRTRGRRVWHLVTHGLTNPLQLAGHVFRITSLGRRVCREIEARYDASFEATNESLMEHVRKFQDLLSASESELAEFRAYWEDIFRRFSDEHTYGHVECVTDLSVLFLAWLAEFDDDKFTSVLNPNPSQIKPECFLEPRFGYAHHFVRMMQIIGLVHDAGKAIIPPDILSAPGRLSEEQVAIMKAHVQFSHIIGQALYPRALDAIDIAVMHHENEDGTGYFRGLTSDQIPPLAKIVRIVDVYHAMRGARPYRDPQSIPRLTTIRVLQNDANRAKIHGWLTWKFVGFIFFLQKLRNRGERKLEQMNLSRPMREFLSEIEKPMTDQEANQLLAIQAELKSRFADRPLVFPWDEALQIEPHS